MNGVEEWTLIGRPSLGRGDETCASTILTRPFVDHLRCRFGASDGALIALPQLTGVLSPTTTFVLGRWPPRLHSLYCQPILLV